MDRILIKDLLVRCIIGINDDERRDKQDVVINVILLADLQRAGRTDRLTHSVDYRAIKKRIFTVVEASSFFLIEALAERIADLCLNDSFVQEVTVLVEKPSALRFARSVGVEITRRRSQ
jgi:FolB domain-containing protein